MILSVTFMIVAITTVMVRLLCNEADVNMVPYILKKYLTNITMPKILMGTIASPIKESPYATVRI